MSPGPRRGAVLGAFGASFFFLPKMPPMTLRAAKIR
jgi:hypothetical protein